MLTKTYVAKPGELEQKWYLVDGAGKVVGRLATEIATILMGKHRPTYTPHVDTGEYVIVVNAEQLVFTGRKWEQKEYTYYTGYHRLRADIAGERREKTPALILTEAVRRMLPKNKLATKMLDKLKVFAGPNHPHQAQNPIPKDLGVRKANTKK
jgi:large subunit ribosomal protein L13